MNSRQLREEADRACRKIFGDKVWLRALIEFSSHCVRSCRYCGLRRENRRAVRYRMTETEILAAAEAAAGAGIGTVVLQSGDDPAYSSTDICRLIEQIKRRSPSAAITLSVGERPLADYRDFRRAGADRYLLKFETANPELYRRLHPAGSLSRRLEILSCLDDLGYEVGAGNIVGLPGQTAADLDDDLALLERLQPAMVGTGPFLPAAGTPLAESPPGEPEGALDFLARVRLALPQANLPATTALGTQGRQQQVQALGGGANVLMVGFTPFDRAENYSIYDGRAGLGLAEARRRAADAGKTASGERGDSPATARDFPH